MDPHAQPGTRTARDAAVAWFTKLRDPLLRASERAEFTRWRNADPANAAAYAEIEAVWKQLDDVPSPAPLDAAERTSRFTASFETLRPVLAPLAAAACVALLAVGWIALPEGGANALFADVRTATGEVRSMRLADGTDAWLDAGSALSLDVTGKERRVTLIAGRAFFKVHHEARPFVVAVDNAEVHDIGTAFEVERQREGGGRVAVSEGSVEVAVPGKPRAPLSAGEGATFDATIVSRRQVSSEDVAAWRAQRLVFIDAGLKDVLAELERHGAGHVIVTDRALENRRITGAFDARRPEAALAAILDLAGARAWHLWAVTVVRPSS
ncbi:MAG: FecR domain-containing protein [Gammaproteobacteria bacterium]